MKKRRYFHFFMLNLASRVVEWGWKIEKFALSDIIIFFTYILKHVFRGDIFQQQKDEIQEYHSNKFSPNHDYEQAVSIQPAIHIRKKIFDWNFPSVPWWLFCELWKYNCSHIPSWIYKYIIHIFLCEPLFISNHLYEAFIVLYAMPLYVYSEISNFDYIYNPILYFNSQFSFGYTHKIMQQIGNQMVNLEIVFLFFSLSSSISITKSRYPYFVGWIGSVCYLWQKVFPRRFER